MSNMAKNTKKMRGTLTIVVWMLAVLTVGAQQRIPCIRNLMRNGPSYMPLYENINSVSSKTGDFHIPVVFAAFQDVEFTIPEILEKWNAMLNQEGYNEHGTAGCIADFFKVQSSGKFNLTFDVIGPVTLPETMKYYGENMGRISGNDMRPEEMIRDACLAANEAGTDFSPYDWNEDGTIDVVIVVYAGKGEHKGGGADAVWPHMASIYQDYKVGGLKIMTYSCTCELNAAGEQDGYGTFCHEFSHTLGLPDLYPTSGNEYSIFDEWDLMDGGNYSNNGWGITNYSAFERNLCGWLDLHELTEETEVTDLRPMDDEPKAYLIRNDEDAEDYYILENRRQLGFDYFIPGNGLLVTHVLHYDGSLFPNSSYRTTVGLVPADNRKYRESESFFKNSGLSKYDENGRNRYLSLAAYPYFMGDSINDHLTDTSLPAMSFAGKPVTNIRLENNGSISFDFMKPTAIEHTVCQNMDGTEAYYDMNGHRYSTLPRRHGIYVIRHANGQTRKIVQ